MLKKKKVEVEKDAIHMEKTRFPQTQRGPCLEKWDTHRPPGIVDAVRWLWSETLQVLEGPGS